MGRKLRKGDEVVVVAGNDRGKIGKIQGFRGERVIVEGVNIRRKCMKKSQQHPKGQIIDIECPIHYSNVMLCVEGKGVRISTRWNAAGEKVIAYKQGDVHVDYRTLSNTTKS